MAKIVKKLCRIFQQECEREEAYTVCRSKKVDTNRDSIEPLDTL